MTHHIFVPALLVYIQEQISGASCKWDIKVRAEGKKRDEFQNLESFLKCCHALGYLEYVLPCTCSILGQLGCLEENVRPCDCQ